MLISAKDPSQHEFIGNIAEEGLEAKINIENIKAGVIASEDSNIIDSFPSISNDELNSMQTFTWENGIYRLLKKELKTHIIF
ncbi:hypothetical protein [Jeotgalicoccus aerolatus]|uniref:hypothetical protein n=1 Tax=Jeotgalicoccus aerolatus TaxID=709510 RepID=UPI000B84D860|nr:hypothetical protein [Jeotgalicoccus aerolatus]